MDTLSMNSKNSKTSDPNRQLLKFTDKADLKRSDKYIALSNLPLYYKRKNIKSHTKIMNLKYQLKHGMNNLNYLMDYILYQIFKITLNFKSMRNLMIII